MNARNSIATVLLAVRFVGNSYVTGLRKGARHPREGNIEVLLST